MTDDIVPNGATRADTINPALRDRTAARAQIVDLRDDCIYRLGALIKAAELLSNHQRVLRAVSGLAAANENFDELLSGYCADWGDPEASDPGGDALVDLLRVAHAEANALAHRAELLLTEIRD